MMMMMMMMMVMMRGAVIVIPLPILRGWRSLGMVVCTPVLEWLFIFCMMLISEILLFFVYGDDVTSRFSTRLL